MGIEDKTKNREINTNKKEIGVGILYTPSGDIRYRDKETGKILSESEVIFHPYLY